MIEILDIREATDEEIHKTDKAEEKPEWKKRMMDNFLRRPACKHTCFGAAAGDCGRCAE